MLEANEWLIIFMFGSFVLLLLSGFPVAYVLGGVGIIFAGIGYFADIYLDTVTGLDFQSLGLLVNRVYKVMDNWVLVALPMFILMGHALDRSDLAKQLMRSLTAILGNLKGGLAYVVLFIGVLLAASTGIIGASVVLLGTMALPSMLGQKYPKDFAVGVVCSAGCLGILIPPSIMLVIMADQLSMSVGDLFLGSIGPGLLLFFLYLSYVFVLSILKGEKFKVVKEPDADRLSIVDHVKCIFPPLLLIFLVLGSIFFGVATPTEASGIGAFGALVLAAIRKRLNRSVLSEICLETLKTTSFILAIVLGATCFSLVLRELGGDEFIERILSGIPGGAYSKLAIILGAVFLLGFFLDWIEITLIILPLVAPLIGQYGFEVAAHGVLENPETVWFCVLVALTLQTSFLTPPVGFALFYIKGVCPPDVTNQEIYKGVRPFIVLQILAIIIVAIWPSIVTWLPAQSG